MQIEFRTNPLQRRYECAAEAERAWGAVVARKYIQRINILKYAKDRNEVIMQSPLRCHPLKGDRLGQYSILLHDRWRLIVTFQKETIEVVCIEEVSKHYGD